VIGCFHSHIRFSERTSKLALERVIKATKQDSLVSASATVYRDHEVTLSDKIEALPLIKKMAAQVKGSVIARWFDAFEEIEVEVIASNGARDLGGSGLDASTVWSDHRDTRTARGHHDLVVLPSNL
jgi:hypothetical protein